MLHDDPNKSDQEKALDVLCLALQILGWKALEPDDEENCQGLVIGTPEYIQAWEELRNQKKDNCQ